MKANDILEKAARHMKDRASTYDNPEGERSMGKTVEMFNTLYGLSVTEEHGWAFMAILKMVRSSQGDYRADNYEDLTAYAALMGESASPDEEVQRIKTFRRPNNLPIATENLRAMYRVLNTENFLHVIVPKSSKATVEYLPGYIERSSTWQIDAPATVFGACENVLFSLTDDETP